MLKLSFDSKGVKNSTFYVLDLVCLTFNLTILSLTSKILTFFIGPLEINISLSLYHKATKIVCEKLFQQLAVPIVYMLPRSEYNYRHTLQLSKSPSVIN